MSVLDTTKQIFLSEKINDSDRRLIVRSYYTSYLKKLSVEIDKETDKISEKFLNKYYDKHLGKSWNKLAEKYKLRQHNIYLFYEKSLIKEGHLEEKYFGSYFSSGLKYFSSKEYPIINCDLQKDFEKSRLKKKLVSLLYEKIEIQNKIIHELLSSGVMTEYKSFLPGIITYNDLYTKYPKIFNSWIQTLLKSIDSVKIISIDEEVNNLKKFLEC